MIACYVSKLDAAAAKKGRDKLSENEHSRNEGIKFPY